MEKRNTNAGYQAVRLSEDTYAKLASLKHQLASKCRLVKGWRQWPKGLTVKKGMEPSYDDVVRYLLLRHDQEQLRQKVYVQRRKNPEIRMGEEAGDC